MIDLHTHVLPGVDDGPDDVEEARALLEAFREDGVRHVVATPHYLPGMYEPDRASIETARDRMQGLVSDVSIHPGREIRLSDPEAVDLVVGGTLRGLGEEARYVLVEFPFAGIPLAAGECLRRIRDAGRVPVIAHPERNAEIRRDPGVCGSFREIGARLQINAGSVLGREGKDTRDAARDLFQRGWVSFLSSDAHDLRHRVPCLSDALEVLENDWSVERPRRFVEDNPRAVLEGRDLPADVSSRPV